MARGYMTGMQAVYLTAAELTKRELIVSPTARSAFGADLLVTDASCGRAWSVQVKANRGRPTFWLLNKHSEEIKSRSHVYVFVNLGQKNARQMKKPPDFFVVPSRIVSERMRSYDFSPAIKFSDVEEFQDRWEIFGVQG